jgi:hypothetical protein
MFGLRLLWNTDKTTTRSALEPPDKRLADLLVDLGVCLGRHRDAIEHDLHLRRELDARPACWRSYQSMAASNSARALRRKTTGRLTAGFAPAPGL